MRVSDLEELLKVSSSLLGREIGFELCKNEVSLVVGNQWVERRFLTDYKDCDKVVMAMLGELISSGIKLKLK
tara:strand:+ start:5157 stop:5372 length:216 start_codon:yes stop_codon:yes gene_type:complete